MAEETVSLNWAPLWSCRQGTALWGKTIDHAVRQTLGYSHQLPRRLQDPYVPSLGPVGVFSSREPPSQIFCLGSEGFLWADSTCFRPWGQGWADLVVMHFSGPPASHWKVRALRPLTCPRPAKEAPERTWHNIVWASFPAQNSACICGVSHEIDLSVFICVCVSKKIKKKLRRTKRSERDLHVHQFLAEEGLIRYQVFWNLSLLSSYNKYPHLSRC